MRIMVLYQIYGSSAWVPATGLFHKISKAFPSLKFHYWFEEQGCDFAGWSDIHNGVYDENMYTFWEAHIRYNQDLALHKVQEEIEYLQEEGFEITHLTDLFYLFSEENRLRLLEIVL